jgi:competence protein ComEC
MSKLLKSQANCISFCCLAMLGFIYLGKIKPLSKAVEISPLVIFVVVIFLLLAYSKKLKLRLPTLILLCSLAYLNASNTMLRLNSYRALYGQKISLIGNVEGDGSYDQYGNYEFDLSQIKLLNPDGETSEISGKIRIKTQQRASVHRGATVFVEGKLKPAMGSRIGAVSYAQVEVIEDKLNWLEDFRLRFFTNIYSSLPEPQASLGIGFLAGMRSAIDKKLQDAMSRIGLSHIVAVSGYNLTILAVAISRLGKGRLSKYQKAVLSIGLISLFILFTGFSPSVIRAGIVSFISISCLYFGRRIRPLNIILIPAALTATLNPVYLWSDLGWWLSFLAFFGVLILAPQLNRRIFKDGEGNLLGSIAIETLSAQILTAPLIAWAFGSFSVIGFLANIIILPTVPLIMLLVFLAGMAGFLSLSLARIITVIPKMMLTVDVWIMEKLANLDWAQLSIKVETTQMLICYGLILMLCVALSKNANRRLLPVPGNRNDS